MNCRFVLFDFDGTLFDTSEGILNGIGRALAGAGMPVHSREELYKFIGPPVVQALKEFCGMTEEEAADAAIEAVRKLSKAIGIPQKLHELGIKEEQLKQLSEDAFIDPCTGGNPRKTSPAEILEIYKKAL